MGLEPGWDIEVLCNTLQTLASGSQHQNTEHLPTYAAPANPGLSDEVREHLKQLQPEQLSPLPGKGLAHDHIVLDGTGLLLRIPKQSQLGLNALLNLQYQAACFERMWPSHHTPQCHGMLEPCADIQMGALLVEHMPGKEPKSAADFASIASALASIHRLPLPAAEHRAPLYDQPNPMKETFAEVSKQGVYLAKAPLDKRSLAMIESELARAQSDVERLAPSPVTLISFDAHPGNYLIDDDGKAVLVDLEKGRYGGAGFDLAHATLYTSTTWDIDVSIELSLQDVNDFYESWVKEVPKEFGDAMQPYLIPMRRLMWLWSVTWCCKWLVESKAEVLTLKHQAQSTEDWATDNNSEKLVSHVHERVSHYLQPEVIERICKEFG